jgi:bifunctional non-homologous end joining protein LigD
VQKSYFLLPKAEREILDIALERYQPGQRDPILLGGSGLLKTPCDWCRLIGSRWRGIDNAEIVYIGWIESNFRQLGKKFPTIAESIAKLDVQGAIIEGEIVALDEQGRSSFQLLQGFDIGAERPPIIFYAFDLLQLDDKDLKTAADRRTKSETSGAFVKSNWRIALFDQLHQDIAELVGKAKDLGLERLIGKRSGSRYEAGKRSGAWGKIKLHLEREFVIGGHTDPDDSRLHFGVSTVA